jgi:dTDP-4-amino-4,6-dideoxygalactose transaminase
MVPAFNCGVVRDAIIAAGFELQLYDFSAVPGFFDWEKIIDEMSHSVGVLVVTHYYGVPVDFQPIIEHCRNRGIAIIEDCAHTLGGTINDRVAGTLGDASIFSFNYDKPISLGWGGLVVINSSVAFELGSPIINRVPNHEEELALWRMFTEALKFRRRTIPYQFTFMFRLCRRLSLFNLKQFNKATNVGLGAIQAELGRWCLKKYAEVLKQRNANAERLSKGVSQITWPVSKGVEPAWLKQKVFVKDTYHLTEISKELHSHGIRVGNFNWPRLITAHEQEFPLSSQAARNWIDVPIHQNLSLQHLDLIIATFKEENR